MRLTSGAMAPDIFRRWLWDLQLAAALERRVWVKATGKVTYPTQYVFRRAPVGKADYRGCSESCLPKSKSQENSCSTST